MKPIFSWLLLFIVSFHWIGGHVYFRISNFVEQTYQMSDAENTIAQALQNETGITADIEIVELNEADVASIGYSGTFIFSEEVNGEKVNYTIKNNTDYTAQERLIGGDQHQPDHQQNKISGKLFPQLFHQETIQHLPNATIERIQHDFEVSVLRSIFNSSIPCPPPDAA